MTVNKVEFLAQKRLPKDMQEMRHDIKALKNPQPLGADVLSVQGTPGVGSVLAASSTVASGNLVQFSITCTPPSATQTLTLWNFAATLYVDTPAVATNEYGGISNTLTTEQKNLIREDWFDWAESSDVTNTRVYKMRVKNNGASSHTYYLYFKAYLPTLGGSTAQ
jgi:hypothetical protein